MAPDFFQKKSDVAVLSDSTLLIQWAVNVNRTYPALASPLDSKQDLPSPAPIHFHKKLTSCFPSPFPMLLNLKMKHSMEPISQIIKLFKLQLQVSFTSIYVKKTHL